MWTFDGNNLSISKTRNNETLKHGKPEQHHSGTRNTGTLKIRRKKLLGVVKLLLENIA